MSGLLVGSTRNGWEIDTEKQELVLSHPISFYDKLKKVEQKKHIWFSEIKKIYVGWNNVPASIGENQHFILLNVILKNNEEICFEGTKNDISKELFKKAILLLKEYNVNFDDPYHILDKIINTNESVWNILNEAELQRRKLEKNK